MKHRVTIRYSDGAQRVVEAAPGETLLDVADAHGVPIVSDCRSGVCGTCVGRCASGRYAMGDALALSRQEKERGWVLACQMRPQSDCVIELDYGQGRNAARLVSGEAVLRSIEQLSPRVARLVLDVSRLPEPLAFRAGQFAQLRVPGTDQWRSYSFAHAPRACAEVEFLVRLLPDGVMSGYLRERARSGDPIEIRGAKGAFHAQPSARPTLLIAGGTGLSAILAIAEELLREQPPRLVLLDYGVREEADLVLLSRLEEMRSRCATFRYECSVEQPSPTWRGRVGSVVDLLDAEELRAREVDVYACGPAPMVDSVRDWLDARALRPAGFFHERFTPTGVRSADGGAAPALTPAAPATREDGRGTALVIGGSIAGMAAAKVLSEHFARVIVLEKDRSHGRTEARPGAAQGWHLHHLLIAGQRQLDAIFPGIIDDMVAAGAFRVDMGEQYRIMLAGSWKSVAHAGIEIVCAGRPLLEWCVRRRLDREAAVEYRYESEVVELSFDAAANRVTGAVVARHGATLRIAAELVVDASGKNTPVPALLGRAGAGEPEIEEDCVNCFYSTMQHRVPPERAWRSKVMVICHAHRPQQQYYAAQYYTDSTRTVLSTSLVGYDCHRPPRDADEFREFARRMPSHVVGSELDGLEPCSPVYNFRYPEMRRVRYERMARLPAGLVAVGDAYASADPVSGAGMTKALLEIGELRALLRAGGARQGRLARRYYRRARKITDRIWLLIREQNLRYPWIEDVKRKRAFYSRALNWYVDRVFEALHEDAEVHRRYLQVSHFVAEPSALFAPRIAKRVLGRWLGTRIGGGPTLLERNFGNGRSGDWGAPLPDVSAEARSEGGA
ncbi:MAG: 2Fe-2S iron-sulfur cluster-binding protein [Myxococcota bacterium]